MEFIVEPIGYVRAARQTPEDDNWGGAEARIELVDHLPEAALAGLDAFSHAEIIFVFDQVDPGAIVTGARHPRNNPAWPAVGIFAQRGKNRPNRLGLTIVRVLGVAGRVVRVAELDAIEGTPVLDIKPVMAEFLPRTPVEQPAWSHALMCEYWRTPGDPLTHEQALTAISLRPARTDDAPFIRSLAYRLLAVGVPPWRDLEQVQDFHIRDVEAAVAAIDGGTVLTATRGEERLGVVHATNQQDVLTGTADASIALLVVTVAAEGLGVGRRLLEAAEE